jgi:membrane-associated phospholipid phosphatase
MSSVGRLLLVLVVAATWWFSYSAINAYNSQAERAVYLEGQPSTIFPFLIQPFTAVVYTLGAAVLVVWPLIVCWQWQRLRLFLLANAVGTAVGFSVFGLWPLAMKRPCFTSERFGEAIMRWVFALDDCANCFPSFHAFFAITGALFVHRYRPTHPAEWLAAYLLAAAVVVTTITTGQHYFIDPVGGAALAFTSFYVSRWLLAV